MSQLMPLPLTVSFVSKIQIGITFLVPAHQGTSGKRTVKCTRLCVGFRVHVKIASRICSKCSIADDMAVSCECESVQTECVTQYMKYLFSSNNKKRICIAP